MILAAAQLEKPGLLSADVGDDASPRVDHVFGPITEPAASTEGFEAVDYPHGTLMLASRACLQSIGVFDERYFAYCEEADLGLRAKRAGFDVGLVRGARVVNPQVDTPTAVVDYLKERNTVLLVFEHFGLRKALFRFVITIWQFIAGLVMPSRRGEYWSTTARLLAIRDVVRRSWGPPPQRLFAR
jgi:GT2 family glycosyltransferase